LKSLIPQSLHVPFSGNIQSNDLEASLKLYYQIESSIHALPKPTAIICKSATRASAAYAAYKVKKILIMKFLIIFKFNKIHFDIYRLFKVV
jgi:hypothetical protein